MSKVNKAVILAAGRGKRLGALTAELPKPMIPIQGRPVLEHILLGLKDTGVSEFLIVIGYKGQAIISHFGDGSKLEIRIQYAEQPVPTGTGAALLLGKEFAGVVPIVCSFGDILTDYHHYRLLMERFDHGDCSAVLGINWVDDPAAGGAVYRERDRVTRVVEKPPPGTSQSNWNLAGVNVVGAQIFEVLDSIEPSPRGEIEITSAFAGLIERGKSVCAVEFHGFWSDVGTPQALRDANERWRNSTVE